MIRALLARLLRHHLALFASVAAGLALFEVLIVRVAAAFELGPGMKIILEMMPQAVRTTFESQVGLISYSSAVAFGFQHPFAFAGAIAFVVVAATIPAAEVENGFLAFILARPVPRRAYLAAPLALVVIASIALPLCQLAGATIALSALQVKGGLPWWRYAPCALGLSALLLAIGGLALLAAAGARRRAPAVSSVAGIVLATWVLEFLADFWPALAPCRWVSPFHYFKPIPAAVSQILPARDPIVLVAIFAVATFLAMVRFERRDA